MGAHLVVSQSLLLLQGPSLFAYIGGSSHIQNPSIHSRIPCLQDAGSQSFWLLQFWTYLDTIYDGEPVNKS